MKLTPGLNTHTCFTY